MSGVSLWMAFKGMRSGQAELSPGLTMHEWGGVHRRVAVATGAADMVIDWKP